MLPALLLAAACAGWHADATGFYRGEVESIGPKAIDTWIEDSAAGLHGRYVLHEPSHDVSGTLEALGDESCDVGLFQWTDIYGRPASRGSDFTRTGTALRGIGAARSRWLNYHGIPVSKER